MDTLFLPCQNYAFWSTRMRPYLQAQGLEVWQIVKTSFTLPEGVDEPTDPTEKRKYVNNSKAMCAILGGITEADFVKVRHCTSAKEIRDKLHTIYEGDDKVKRAKLQTHRRKFEQLYMKEEENIAGYHQRVAEVTNTIRGLGENMPEDKVVVKILRSLTPRFDSKVSAIEELKDLNT